MVEEDPLVELGGHWWLPEDAEYVVPGRLSIDAAGRSTIGLIGGFSIHDELTGRYRDPYPVVYGTAEGKSVTGLSVLAAQTNEGLGRDVAKQTLRPGQVFVGDIHVSPETEFRFGQLEIENLNSFLQFNTATSDDDLDLRSYQASVFDTSSTQAVIDGWVITAHSFAQPFQMTRTHARDTLKSDTITYLTLRPKAPASLTDFLTLANRLAGLVTLASGRACGILRFELFGEDAEFDDGRGGEMVVPQSVHLYGERVHTAIGRMVAPYWHEFLFTCSDLPFEQAVASWIALYGNATSAIAVMLGTVYARPAYTEARALLLATAVESLSKSLHGVVPPPSADYKARRQRVLNLVSNDEDRRWLRDELRPRLSFLGRAQRLLQELPPTSLTALALSMDDWPTALKDVRNGLAHDGTVRTDDLYDVAEATFAILALTLMREVGLPSEVLDRAASGRLARRRS